MKITKTIKPRAVAGIKKKRIHIELTEDEFDSLQNIIWEFEASFEGSTWSDLRTFCKKFKKAKFPFK